jgi:hypothetical protein
VADSRSKSVSNRLASCNQRKDTAAMTGNTPLPVDLPAVSRKKLTVDFNGPHLVSQRYGQSGAARSHTAAYWLMLTVRDAIPQTDPLAKAEVATIRERLIKMGARVIELLPSAAAFGVAAGSIVFLRWLRLKK